MPLKYPAEWKFDGVGYGIPEEAHNDFFRLTCTIAEGTENPQSVFEDFKSAFGIESWSSSASWAETDLAGAMREAKSNAARYLASFYAGMESVAARGISIPSVELLNRILTKCEIPLLIDPPNLRLKSGDIQIISSRSVDEPPTATFIRGPEIGRGGFGVVYQITRATRIGEYHYAMKVLDPSSFVQNRERAEARFKREMQALEKLQHRGIVQFLEAGFDAEHKPYILMPYVQGTNLREALSGATRDRVIRVFDEVLLALDFAHSKGVIHRDLKPNNVLVRSTDDQPIILDFGCAYLIDELDDSLTTTLIGTSAYIPIEVHRDPKHRSVKQDVYACGVLLYEVIVGRLPDPDDYQPIEDLIDGYNGIDEVILAALAPERRRLDTAGRMRVALNSIAIV